MLFARSTSFPFHIKRPLLYSVSFMLFFWTIFDGIVSYVVPLAISSHGFSETMTGVIIGTSSICGAFFDFILSKFLKNTHFRRVYLFMFGFSFVLPLILWQSKTIFLFFIAMAIWGFYYDLENFGNFDFVGRKSEPEEHSNHFGIIAVFKSTGYMIAPIIAGLVVSEVLDFRPYILMWVFLAVALLFYLLLIKVSQTHPREYIEQPSIKKHNLLLELELWEKVGKIILPILTLTILLNILDAFFWTLGPIMAESFVSIHPFNGLFMTAYTLPELLRGWGVGRITEKFGKKKTAFLGFIIGSFILLLFIFVHNPILLMGIVFLSSWFVSIAAPAVNGAYTDYLAEAPKLEREIEALVDVSGNIGYIIGPIFAGILADHVGNTTTFALLGLIGGIVAIFLMRRTPKTITVPNTTAIEAIS